MPTGDRAREGGLARGSLRSSQLTAWPDRLLLDWCYVNELDVTFEIPRSSLVLSLRVSIVPPCPSDFFMLTVVFFAKGPN